MPLSPAPFRPARRRALTALALALLGAASLPAPLPAQSAAAVNAINEAASLGRAGKLEEAVARYDTAIKAAPKMFQPYAGRGAVRARLAEREKEMSAELSQARAGLPPEMQAAQDAKIKAAEDKSRTLFEGAFADYEMALKVAGKKEKISVLYDRSVAYNQSGEFDKAVADCDAILKEDPKNIRALFQRGLTTFRIASAKREAAGGGGKEAGRAASQADLEKAVADFTQVIQLDPKSASAYVQRGACYTYLVEFEKALDDNAKAIELEPGNRRAYRNRSELYKAMEDIAKKTGDNAGAADAKKKYDADMAKLAEMEKAAAAGPAPGAPPAPPKK